MRKSNRVRGAKTEAIIEILYQTIGDLEDARLRLRKIVNAQYEPQPQHEVEHPTAEKKPGDTGSTRS